MSDLSYFRDRRFIILCMLVVTIFIAGARFSDGSMLLAISNGESIASPVFQSSLAQYVFDSPLKVMFLNLIPANILIIAIAFGMIAMLPVIGLLSDNEKLLWLALVTVFLTPAFKISIQNMGVGDGLIIAAIILAVFKSYYRVIALSFFVIALWHPQQSFFIGLSFLISRYAYSDKFNITEAIVIIGTLIIAAVFFFTWKASLGFDYLGREEYMVERMQVLINRDPLAYPIAFIPIVAWFLLLAPKPKRGGFLMLAWLGVLACVSLATTDITRVMTIISLLVVLIGALDLKDSAATALSSKAVILAIIIALTPIYSWSGLDYFIWSDLIKDACKWGLYCSN